MHSNTRQALSTRTLDRLNHGRLERSSAKLRHAKSRQARALKRQASCLLRVDAFFSSLLNASKRQASCLYKLPLREMVLGKSRQAHQRTIMHSNTRQAANNHAHEHSTGCERVDAFGLREMVLGKSRQAHQRTAGSPANAKLITFRYPSSLIRQSLDPAARALKRQDVHVINMNALERERCRGAKWYWVNHGRLTSERQAHQRTQSLLPSATHRHSSITRPCCSSAQAPRRACNQHEWPGAWTLQRREKKTRERKAYLPLPIVTHQSLDPAARALKRQASCLLRVDAFATRSRGNHMHDHSRFQRDIDWRHRRLSLSLSLSLYYYYYSQKSLTHNIGNASAFPIIPVSTALLKKNVSTYSVLSSGPLNTCWAVRSSESRPE